ASATIVINGKPDIAPIATQSNCPSSSFDVSTLTITDNNNIAGTTTTFHSMLPTNASNQLSSTVISSSQTIYVQVANATTGCYDIESFMVNITNTCSSSGPDLNLSGTLENGITYTYTACNNIISDVTIQNGASVDYIAGQFIRLTPGFVANSGATFEAKIVACTPLSENDAVVQPRSRHEPLAKAPSVKVFPNPFRGQTTIELEMSEPEPITLSLYDLSGRKMVDLVNNAPLRAGIHQFQWQATQVEAGMYLLALNGRTMQKLVVTR
ncbi:MAG: 3-coathanger stack domain-containing protein, partial [Bacteroidota bacterium]